MANIKTINVTGLEHEEKEKLLFPNLEELNIGDELNVIFDFNPIPLTYMLKARNEFALRNEKEGPPEWILNIKRTSASVFVGDKNQAFKNIIRQMKAKKSFQGIDAKALAVMEQGLRKEDTSKVIEENICNLHLEGIRDVLIDNRIDVKSPHPVATFMEEHEVILETLEKLTRLIEKIESKNSFAELGSDIEKFKEIAHHLVEAESHHQREEDGLFPKMDNHGITDPTEVMKMDHIEFLKKKRSLYNFTYNWQDFSFAEYKKNIMDLGKFLAKELEIHIFKEDNILYQIALQVLTEAEWNEVKRDCDKIGYCCFTPADQKQTN